MGAPISVRVSWRIRSDEKSFRARGPHFQFREQFRDDERRLDLQWISILEWNVQRAARRFGHCHYLPDPDALINNPRPGRENDKIWQVSNANVPRVGTPVTITIHLEKSRNQ